MGQINDGLDPSFKEFDAQFIEQQSNAERNNQVSDDFQDCDINGIEKDGFAIIEGEEIGKVFQTDPGGAEDPFAGVKILESNHQAEHWDDLEDEDPDQAREKHQIIVLFELFNSHEAFLKT